MKKIYLEAKKRAGKYWEIVLYLFFGVCTVLVNMIFYALFHRLLDISNLWSTIFAWLLAVAFAFLTNKKFVFSSACSTMREQLKEMSSFFLFRTFTGVLDVVIMIVAVDCMHWDSLLWKLISNIIVTVLNYIASKLLIFR